MGQEKHPLFGRSPNRNLTLFLDGVVWIIKGKGQWVKEDRRRFGERNAVFAEIGSGLSRIPFIRRFGTMGWGEE
jgi:hypothetical protein